MTRKFVELPGECALPEGGSIGAVSNRKQNREQSKTGCGAADYSTSL